MYTYPLSFWNVSRNGSSLSGDQWHWWSNTQRHCQLQLEASALGLSSTSPLFYTGRPNQLVSSSLKNIIKCSEMIILETNSWLIPWSSYYSRRLMYRVTFWAKVQKAWSKKSLITKFLNLFYFFIFFIIIIIFFFKVW